MKKVNIDFERFKSFLFKYKFLVVAFIFLLVIGVILIPRAFAQPVKSVEIISDSASFEDKTPGAWKVDKSAKWISKGEAEITFDVDTIMKSKYKYYDVLFVFDISGSMEGNKISKVKEDSRELINDLFSKPGNRAGIITFSTESDIVSQFTDDKESLINNIDSLSVTGDTNYYQALVNVDNVLKDYASEEDRGCVVLFLTDGYPNTDTPNEIGQYSYLKKTYPYITINGIQYEMGDKVLEQIKSVSDNQFVADMDTLNNTLFEAAYSPIVYDDFEVTDNINTDYFYIENERFIDVEQGNVVFDKDNQKVTWKIDNLRSGSKTKMTIKVKLKEEFIGQGGVYQTNKSEEIHSKLEEVEDNIVSDKTPVLLDNYQVIYDGNAPAGCHVSDVPATQKASVYDAVELSDATLSCEGYQFKGWKITTKNVSMINSDYFVMPESDVEVKANWGKIGINKSMSGELKESLTLYKQVEEDVKDPSKFAKEYTGDTSTFKGNQGVYYYYGAAANNNVVFANYCWKIVRTTDTGGVKLLYNGEPDAAGSCDNSGDKSALTAEQIGSSNNRVSFNNNTSSLADVGYMYNLRYPAKRKNISGHIDLSYYERMSTNESSNYYYADTFEYVAGGSTSFGTYYLESPQKINWSKDDNSNLVGKYTCKSTSSTECNTIYYVLSVDKEKLYYVSFYKGEDAYTNWESTITLGSSISSNSDGTYSLINPIVVNKADWSNSKYFHYYICLNNELTCSAQNMKLVSASASRTSVVYVDAIKKIKYGNSFVYENGEYTLVNTINVSDPYESNVLDNNHYTCFNESGICEEINYVYDRASSGHGSHYEMTTYYEVYISLTEGKSVENAVNEMLYDDSVNTYDSNIKQSIDYWYANEMIDYTSYLEDTVWCNDRGLKNLDVTGWNPNGGTFRDGSLYFGTSSGLTCANLNDRFTVKTENGNGKLVYPVGLIDGKEVSYADISNDKSPFSHGISYWTISPESFMNSDDTIIYSVYNDRLSGDMTTNLVPIRPAVSLHAGIKYTSGDGSVSSPYVVDMDTDNKKYNITLENKDDYTINFKDAYVGQEIKINTNDEKFRVKSFKINGRSVTGEIFAMPNEDVVITDVVSERYLFDVKIEDNGDIISSKSIAEEGEEITLNSKLEDYRVGSFKLNGKLVNGNKFKMPEADVVITDVITKAVIVIESEHNPYPNSLNDKVYGEKTFNGATSLTVELDYQTEGTSYDWIYLYDSTGKAYGKYGGDIRKKETITIPGDYVKVVFRTDSSVNTYYGFKATITPNYD